MIGLSVVNRRSNSVSLSPCGMLAGRLQLHEIDHIDDANLERRQIVAEDGHGREHFERRHVASRRHDDIGLAAVVGAGPLPSADSRSAVLHRRIHRQPLRRRMLAGDDDVDVVEAAQAVIHHAQQAVRVGRQIHPHHLGFLVDRVIDEPGILMGEAVVILPPDMAGEQVVERRDRTAPRQAARDLQPLRMLIEHRVDDVRERFVGVEETVAAGQQIAFEPALTLVLAEHLEHASLRRQPLVAGDGLGVPLPRRRLEHRIEPIRHGFVRPEDPEIDAAASLSRDDVAQKPAEDARIFGIALAGTVDRRPRSRESPACARSCRSSPPLACGFAPMRRGPGGASAASCGCSAPRASNSCSGR